MENRWRSAYCMTAGTTCTYCFNAGKRGSAAWLMDADEMGIIGYGSRRFNLIRRARMLKHLKAEHPAMLALHFPEAVAA